jgi:hypothetical protein
MSSPLSFALLPWLLLTWLLQQVLKRGSSDSSRILQLGLAVVIAGMLLAIPFQGLSVLCWIKSVMSSCSIPLLGMVSISILETTFSRKIFSMSAWKASSLFGVIASMLLYPSALGLTRIDTYSWGWNHNGLMASITIITAVLLWKKNGFGLLLLLALLSFAFHLQTSTNLWDYLIDPVFSTIAFVIFIRSFLVTRILKFFYL